MSVSLSHPCLAIFCWKCHAGHLSFNHVLKHDLFLLVSLHDPSFSQVSCYSNSSGNGQIIFINIFEGLNNSLLLLLFCSWWHDFLCFFLSIMHLLVHTTHSVCYSTVPVKCYLFYICFSKRLWQKNWNDNLHTLQFLLSILKYMLLHMNYKKGLDITADMWTF